jgi:hypothetical protein
MKNIPLFYPHSVILAQLAFPLNDAIILYLLNNSTNIASYKDFEKNVQPFMDFSDVCKKLEQMIKGEREVSYIEKSHNKLEVFGRG